jgi:hypothetical protein
MPKPKKPDPALPNEAGRLPSDVSWVDRVKRYLRARYPAQFDGQVGDIGG